MRLLFVDRSTKLTTVTDLETKARGGMVASLFKVTDYLSSRGHEVEVLSDIQEPGVTLAGTWWRNEASGSYDCMVTNRGTGSGYSDIEARTRILWTHDLPHSGFIPDPKTIKAFACTVFMSRYAERVWRALYKDIGKSVLIPNGVDKSVFYPREKDLSYLIYASAPNRGLDKLPLIFDAIQARTGGKRMRAYSNLAALHPGEVGQGDAFDYKTVQESAVELLDPVPQAELAEQLGRAGLMVLPSGYPEICSNIVLQALASGTPVITTGNLGATPEWVKHGKNGMLTEYQPHDYMIHTVEMVRNSIGVLEDSCLHKRLIAGARKTRIQTWEEVGRQWERTVSRFC